MSFEQNHGLRYLFIDFNAYFASVEQHDDPALAGRPVIVAPSASEHTSAIAVSYEARQYGIKRGTKISEARELCPGLAVRTARHDRYVVVHKQLMKEIERHLPLNKVYSIDEAAFRLNRSEAYAEAALQVAHRVRAGISDAVGPALRASIGLAPTRLLAKLAAERKKPDGMTVLTLADLPGALEAMPLRDIPGIGASMEVRLERSGITRFLDLWNLEPKHARRIWGSVQGERFWYALHGYEVAEPETQKCMFGHSRVLESAHRRPREARIVARALLLKAASRLRHAGLFATRLSLGIRLPEGGRWGREAHFTPTQDSFTFLHSLDALWGDVPRVPRLLGVTVHLHGLKHPDDLQCIQGDLLADPVAIERSGRRDALWRLIDGINSDPEGKFARLGGHETAGGSLGDTRPRHVMLASQSGLDLSYLGAKIAFSRVPDESEFKF